MRTGISLYMGSGLATNTQVIKKAHAAGASFAFTSLQIPEETGIDQANETRRLLQLCREANLNLIADISPRTLAKLGYSSLTELKGTGIDYVRLDFGFSAAETVELSHDFHIVFNASTISKQDILAWRSAGADFTRFAACHNYYPKPLTGLSIERVSDINRELSDLGFTTMAFIPGDKDLRGPLHESLPTVEAHRGDTADQLAIDALELLEAKTDVIMVGDPDLSTRAWQRLGELSQGYVSLRANIEEPYVYVRNQIHHDRPDSSAYVIRSQESRGYAQLAQRSFDPQPYKQRPLGSISVGNDGYARYAGELEIARCDLPHEGRVNVIGQITHDNLPFLPHINSGFGFKLV